MILRVLNFLVIGALVLAAAYVYRIKYDSTVQAERLARMRAELRHERDKIAGLRAQWSELDDPGRIEELTKRFLKLKPVSPTQFDNLDHLPDQPPDYMRPGSKDPIGGMIEHLEEPADLTGSVRQGDGARPEPGPGQTQPTSPSAASANPDPDAPAAEAEDR